MEIEISDKHWLEKSGGSAIAQFAYHATPLIYIYSHIYTGCL